MSLTTGRSVDTLPTLEEVKASIKDRNVPLEAAWIWGQDDEVSTRCGMQAWSDHGVVGRGVLLDYYRWKAEVKNEPYDAFTSHAIHLDELKAVAAYQNVEFQVGDILLVRSGYTATYYKYEKSAPERLVEAGTHKPNLTGLAQTE
ncbi:cyclase [Fusarium tjaetaba]|uniref:Cyclase n=1 Tax=Fusarium tjaetaba TaxID=1567544 RepID=A0A8H5S5N2_9HYPO|nr:cyclase [Fusarium tjaetaba]KAF5646991.1 cyclase [Fusarium tjaetaba]